MPRIAEKDLESVIYLYRSRYDAEHGLQNGGTGFLISVPSPAHPEHEHVYAVTNRHVIQGGSPVIRRNAPPDGGMDILETGTSNWLCDPDHDLAICFIGDLGARRFCVVRQDKFITDHVIREYDIGPGDDTMMFGRFVNKDGKQKNTPTVRFGSIAMMPNEPIDVNNQPEYAFLVEVRSISGYSGSPVFVHLPLFASKRNPDPSKSGPWLLGINCAYITNPEPLRHSNGSLVEGGYWVNSNTGIAVIIPAWELRKLLDRQDVKMARDQADDELSKRKIASGVVLTSSEEEPRNPKL